MGIEIVLNDHNLVNIRIEGVRYIFHKLSIILFGSLFTHLNNAPTG